MIYIYPLAILALTIAIGALAFQNSELKQRIEYLKLANKPNKVATKLGFEEV